MEGRVMEMSGTVTYASARRSLRTVEIGGRVWLVAKDACRGLGFRRRQDAMRHLDSPLKRLAAVDTARGTQVMEVVSAEGFGELVRRSKGVRALEFSDWVRSEVLAPRRVEPADAIRASLGEAIEELDAMATAGVALAERLSELASLVGTAGAE